VNIYPFIEAEKACRRNVKRACRRNVKVSRAVFNQHLRGPSQRERADAELAGQIQAVHQESRGRYAAPRVHPELHRHSPGDQVAVAALNGHPRKTLGWKTPAEALDEFLYSCQQGGVGTTP
jgi:hypothetical protein